MAFDFTVELGRIDAAIKLLAEKDIEQAMLEVRTLEAQLLAITAKHPKLEVIVITGPVAIGFGTFGNSRQRGFFVELPPLGVRVSPYSVVAHLLAVHAGAADVLASLEFLVTAQAPITPGLVRA